MVGDPWTWLEAWSAALGPAMERAITAVAGQLPDADIVGVGIATDADATSIVAFANSRSHLDRMIAEDPESALDGRWHLGEWDRGLAGPDDPLAPIRSGAAEGMRLFTRSEVSAVPGIRAFRESVWGAISRAMTDAVTRGFFDRWPNAVRVFLPLDADVPEHRIADWNAALNGPAEHRRFREFLQLDD